MCLELTVRAPKWRIIGIVLVSSLLSFKKFHAFIWCFRRWLLSLYRGNKGQWNLYSRIFYAVWISHFSLSYNFGFWIWIKILFLPKAVVAFPLKLKIKNRTKNSGYNFDNYINCTFLHAFSPKCFNPPKYDTRLVKQFLRK